MTAENNLKKRKNKWKRMQLPLHILTMIADIVENKEGDAEEVYLD